MRVLFLSWRDPRNPRAGGAELYTHEVARRLVARGDSVEWFVASFPGAAPHDPRGRLRMGWVDVWTLNDMAAVMPADVTREARELEAAWEADVEELPTSEASSQRINAAIEELRQATLASLRALR